MKATVLIDNIGTDEMKGEWGLSILCEYEGKKILLDVGASNTFAKNAEKLGFELKDVDYAVLSHAHFDHGNGMRQFFDENSKAKFYLRETTEENCYKKILFIKKYIGIPRHVLTDYADRIEIVSGDYQLCEGVYLIPHKCEGLEKIGKQNNMYQKIEGKWLPDNFSHEQSLVFDTDKGLVIFNSCSHGGAANIIKEVSETFPGKKVYGLIGGLHLHDKSESEIEQVAAKIDETNIEYICTGHCTGGHAYGILTKELGDRMHMLSTGLVMEF